MRKIIVLDFDDTLTDNLTLDFHSFNYSLKQFNIKNTLTKSDLKKLRKKRKISKDIINYILKKKQKHLENEILFVRKNFLQSIDANNYLNLKSHTKQILQFFKKNNFQLFLISVRNEKKIIKQFLVKNKLNIFDNLFCNENLSFNLDNTISQNRVIIKSSLLHNILKHYGDISKNIIYIGNSKEDMEAAQNINTKFIYFQNYYLPKEQIASKFIVKSNNELKKIIPKVIKT
jgi:phosphoglycolate phosphatase-like HAD superfamily hydrolase